MPVVKFVVTHYDASSIYLEQIFVCRVDTQLLFEDVRRNKRFILNINLKKYPRQIQHPTTDLKMELVVKLLMTLNCKLFFQKDLF